MGDQAGRDPSALSKVGGYQRDATQLVLGASRRSRLSALLTGSGIGATVIRRSSDIDVHIVTHDRVGAGLGLPRLGGGIPGRRRVEGFVLAGVLLPLITFVLTRDRGALNLVSDVLAFLLVVVVTALVGGMWPALAAAAAGSALLN